MNIKKVLIRLALVLGVVVLTAAGAIYLSGPNSTRAEAEQYAVYSAYIEDGVNGNSPRPAHDRRDIELIVSTTIPVNPMNAKQDGTIDRWRNSFDSVSILRQLTDPPTSELIRNLFIANMRTHKLEGRFLLSADYKLLDSTWFLTPRGDRVPPRDGFHSFSSVAFNSDLTNALFYTVFGCRLCARSQFVLMTKTNGKWTVVKPYVLWVS